MRVTGRETILISRNELGADVQTSIEQYCGCKTTASAFNASAFLALLQGMRCEIETCPESLCRQSVDPTSTCRPPGKPGTGSCPSENCKRIRSEFSGCISREIHPAQASLDLSN